MTQSKHGDGFTPLGPWIETDLDPTLGPGDVVLTGAPGTCAAVKPGQRCTITLSGIGTLINPVRGR